MQGKVGNVLTEQNYCLIKSKRKFQIANELEKFNSERKKLEKDLQMLL